VFETYIIHDPLMINIIQQQQIARYVDDENRRDYNPGWLTLPTYGILSRPLFSLPLAF